MELSNDLLNLFEDPQSLRAVGEGIYSVLPAGTGENAYDTRAVAYDKLVGNKLYNRIIWGSSTDDYAAFARDAVGSSRDGWFLDAGCGTLFFSADAYIQTPERKIVVLDQSAGMLRHARERVIELAGTEPSNILFLQGDLLHLPFRAGSFKTVMSMGMLHIFDQAESIISSLEQLLAPDGKLFLTSLVSSGRFGDLYLKLLHRAGEVATPRESAELRELLAHSLKGKLSYRTTGNMAFAEAGTGS